MVCFSCARRKDKRDGFLDGVRWEVPAVKDGIAAERQSDGSESGVERNAKQGQEYRERTVKLIDVSVTSTSGSTKGSASSPYSRSCCFIPAAALAGAPASSGFLAVGSPFINPSMFQRPHPSMRTYIILIDHTYIHGSVGVSRP